MKVIIENIGKIVSGDWEEPILKADTVLIDDGRFRRIGYHDEFRSEEARVRIDANGMVLIPGLIDPHTHISIGDYAPMHRMVGVLEEALLNGITTVIDEFNQFEGLPLFYPPDPAGVKSTAITAFKAWRNFRPCGSMKVHAGSITLVKGLAESDFKELSELGIWRVSQNGGSTASSWEMTRQVLDAAPDAAVELVPYGNLKMGMRIVEYLRNSNQLNRIIFGSDTPTGQGYFPVGIQQAIKFYSSLAGIDAEKAIAMATGNTH